MLKRVLITAGGTGGHIYPAIAIIEEFKRRGYEVLFVGNKDSLEKQIAEKREIPFAEIDVQKLYRKVTLKHLVFPFKLLKSLMMSKKIINEFKPDVCIGCGGFVSGPMIIKANQSNIPFYLQEQNSYPGLTTRKMSNSATKIFLGYESAIKYLPQDKCVYIGNPLLLKVSERPDRTLDTGKAGREYNLLILGGSQGAQFINNLILKMVYKIMDKGVRIIWQTGQAQYSDILSKITVKPRLRDKIELFPFTHNISSVYLRSDFAICRAGALSLAELEAYKIPAIIIPLPTSAANHQYHNALHQQNQNKGLLLEQNVQTEEKLLDTIDTLINNYDIFQKHLANSIHATATENIVNTIIDDFKSTNQ